MTQPNTTDAPSGDSPPSSEGLGLAPERAEFEAAAEARGLDTSRTTEWMPLGGQTEDDRPYYNARTSAAWWAWQAAVAAERERCAAILDAEADRQEAAWNAHLASGRGGPATSFHTATRAYAARIRGA